MYKLLFVFFAAIFFAYISEINDLRPIDKRDVFHKYYRDIGFIMLLLVVILFAGLRIDYNDTWNYWDGFLKTTTSFTEFWADKEKSGLLKNPAFNLYCVLIRRHFVDKTAFIMPTAVFSEYCLLRFLKQYSISFDFSVYLFFTLGLFCFTMGAMKQAIAMGFLTFAITAVIEKKYISFVFWVFIAMLFHTYAIIFIIVPFLRAKPWSAFTWIMTIAAVFVFMNLESILGSVIDASEDVGKKLYEEEILGGTGSNIFRILVYAVPPVISFIFRKQLFNDSTPADNIMIHLSILSFACMAYGLVVAGNQADRFATYFELGTLVALPWMIKKAFSKNNYKLIKNIAYVSFFIYFYYQFAIAKNFDAEYTSILSRYI